MGWWAGKGLRVRSDPSGIQGIRESKPHLAAVLLYCTKNTRDSVTLNSQPTTHPLPGSAVTANPQPTPCPAWRSSHGDGTLEDMKLVDTALQEGGRRRRQAPVVAHDRQGDAAVVRDHRQAQAAWARLRNDPRKLLNRTACVGDESRIRTEETRPLTGWMTLTQSYRQSRSRRAGRARW